MKLSLTIIGMLLVVLFFNWEYRVPTEIPAINGFKMRQQLLDVVPNEDYKRLPAQCHLKFAICDFRK